ncbi:MAG: hypothetical protein M3401_00060, partial [Actinomycetota bacterium]|nr:hypothetical protein [Actinomycetota bacterium]
MAAQPRPERTAQPRPERTHSAGSFQPGKRETADERRLRRLAVAYTTQVDLKREAAERRARKSGS